MKVSKENGVTIIDGESCKGDILLSCGNDPVITLTKVDNLRVQNFQSFEIEFYKYNLVKNLSLWAIIKIKSRKFKPTLIEQKEWIKK